jgi:protein-tyrosine sulfotransferase
MTPAGTLVKRVTKRARRWWQSVGVQRWRHRPYVSSARPIIIGGCGRSGTTLMRVILDTHPNICCGPESHLFLPHRPNIRTAARRFGLPDADVEALFHRSRSQAAFVDEFFRAYAARQHKPRWAEKTPRNVLQLDFIFEHFPDARFIHMLRDGRDTVCSLRTHPRHRVVNGELVKLNTWHPLEQCISRWVTDVRAGLRYRQDPRYMEVRYEDLVSDPRATLERVFAFIGEPFDARVLDYHEVRGQSRDVTNFPQNPEATRAMYKGAVSRWAKDLSADDVLLFKRMAGSLLVETGYAVDDAW